MLRATAAAHAIGKMREAVTQQDELLDDGGNGLRPLSKLLAAAKLRNRIAQEPALRDAHTYVDDRMTSVPFGDLSFLDLVASGQSDIETMQQTLAT